MSVTIPRDSRQDIGTLTVLDGVTPVVTFQVAVVPYGTVRLEADWTAPDVIGADRTVIVGPGTTRVLAAGTYMASVRYTSGTLQVVVENIAVIVIT